MNKKEHHHKNEKNNPFSQENNVEKEDELKENNEEITDNKIQEEINTIKSDYDNLNNQYIRLAADFDNYRKRQAQEREALLKYGQEEALKKMIEVLDNFDRAQQSIESINEIGTLKEAFDILHKQFTDSLTKMGLETIETEGKTFDPNLHEAVMQTPTNDYPEETIIKELQKGYKLGDKILRASLVDVAVKE